MHQSVINFDKPTALFPLDSCMLLPHATVPLHIFEDRYIAMVRHALDGDGLISMATFCAKAGQQQDEGRPPIRDHVCVGYIARHQELAGNRYNILVQGLCRARIVTELDHDPYRLAMLAPSEAVGTLEIDMEDHRQQLEALLADPVLQQLAAVGAIDHWTSREIPTMVMVDLAVLTLCSDVGNRYRILAQDDPQVRADWLIGYLRQTRQIMELAGRQRAAQSDSGAILN